ncbi:MAG: hypothetical protein WBD31_11270, partial [Rubripirellula sp.]
MRGLIQVFGLVAIVWASASPIVVAAGVSLGQRKAVQSANAAVQQAGSHFAAGDYESAGQSIREAIKQVQAAGVDGSPEVYELLLPAMRRIGKAHTMLQFEGVSLPPFKVPDAPTAATEPEQPIMKPAEMAAPEPATSRIFDLDPNAVPKTDPAAVPMTDPNAISFTKTVAPILSNRCGGCHINGS